MIEAAVKNDIYRTVDSPAQLCCNEESQFDEQSQNSYLSVFKLWFIFSVSARLVAPLSPILLPVRL